MTETAQPEEELTLIFRVPETDFDGIAVLIAIAWVKRKLAENKGWKSEDDVAGEAALRILEVIHQRYEAALPAPDPNFCSWCMSREAEGYHQTDTPKPPWGYTCSLCGRKWDKEG